MGSGNSPLEIRGTPRHPAPSLYSLSLSSLRGFWGLPTPRQYRSSHGKWGVPAPFAGMGAPRKSPPRFPECRSMQKNGAGHIAKMVRKGVSYDEKRKRMCDYFFEKKEVLTLKELEKKLPKEKGIISQAVKEVLQSLCDDGLIDSDKIGSGNFFWALPSKAINTRNQKLKSLHEKAEWLLKEDEAKTIQIEELERDRPQNEERESLTKDLEALNRQIAVDEEKLGAFNDRGPAKLKQIEAAIQVAREAANRWTDSVYDVESFVKKKDPSADIAGLMKHCNIPEEFDYIP